MTLNNGGLLARHLPLPKGQKVRISDLHALFKTVISISYETGIVLKLYLLYCAILDVLAFLKLETLHMLLLKWLKCESNPSLHVATLISN